MRSITVFPKAPREFPATAQRGTASIAIYYRKRVKGPTTYHEFSIPYTDAGRRRFHTFPTYDKARDKGNEMLTQLAGGETNAVTLNDADKHVYNAARDALKPTGIALDRVAFDYAQLWQRMGGDHFKEAVDQFIVRRETVKAITVPDLVALFIKQKTAGTKRGRPASPDYLTDLRSRLNRFAETCAGPIAALTPDAILTFLDGLGVGGRTRFNYARLLRTLFKFAQSKRFLPKDLDLMEGIETGFEDDSEIEIFTPAEIQRLLTDARPEMISFLV